MVEASKTNAGCIVALVAVLGFVLLFAVQDSTVMLAVGPLLILSGIVGAFFFSRGAILTDDEVKSRFATWLIVSAVLGVACGVALPSYLKEPVRISSYNFPGADDYSDLVVTGNRAYVVAEDWFGLNTDTTLSIIDISNPSAPGLLGTREITVGPDGKIAVLGDMAIYLRFSMQFLNVSDPANIQPIATYNFTGDAPNHLTVDGNYAYCTGQFSGLKIYDITNPASVSEVGSNMTMTDLGGSDKEGDLLYVAGATSLVVFNVSNIASPVIVANLSFNPYEYGSMVVVSGSTAFVGTSKGVIIVDVSNETAPVVRGRLTDGRFSTEFRVSSIQVAGNLLYCTWGFFVGVNVIDITDLTKPTQIGYIFSKSVIAGDTSVLKLTAGKLYALQLGQGLVIYDPALTKWVTPMICLLSSGAAILLVGIFLKKRWSSA